MENLRCRNIETFEITKDIISKEIGNIKKQYDELEELFEKNKIPGCMQINTSIDKLKQIKYHKLYPDLVSKYEWLGKYCGKTIYIFSVNNFPFEKEETKKIFEEVKNEKQVLLCRINEDSPEWEKVQSDRTVCLYVGSSNDIRQRLKEHLFLCKSNTYAMHLEKWFKTDLTFTIATWGFNDFLTTEKNAEHLQNIEDILWSHYKPLLGKQGKK